MLINIEYSAVKALLKVAAKSDIRYYLNGVCVDARADDVTLVACDGHRLLAVPVAANSIVAGQFIIPRDALEAIKPRKSGKHTLPIELTITEPAPVPDPVRPDVTIQAPAQFTIVGATTATGTVVDGRFPDWRKVLPKSASGEAAQFDAEYVGSFGDVTKLLTGDKDNNPVIHHNGSAGALVTIPGSGALGVVMPRRADDTKHPGLPAWAQS